ncbi:MAG: hypothetical protein ACREC8_13730 [Limisphaerales bacterium]
MTSGKPPIRADEPGSSIREFDRLLKEKIFSRQNEIANLRGWKKVLRRIQIELWAWKEALTAKSKKRHKIE